MSHGSTIRPRKFGAPQKTKRSIALAKVKNAQHKEMGLHSSSQPRVRATAKLGRLDLGFLYPDISMLNDEQAQELLKEHSVLPDASEILCCFRCGEQMSTSSSSSKSQSESDTVQCWSCTKPRSRPVTVKHASLAYTPFWLQKLYGVQPPFAAFVRTVFCVATRMPQDMFLVKHTFFGSLLQCFKNKAPVAVFWFLLMSHVFTVFLHPIKNLCWLLLLTKVAPLCQLQG